ncbi:protein ACCELERATED CELL DEATH 6-like [Triticum dicoccoides]|uniref:protein ACCELERATED CELL DEATH 6-like n=1 Tax=Triticum dicoccoides TaxID=85692 RepID=UPI00188F23DA|nr:protein ACCELERATED CELL DEATH 6-like [Triticum dicoccoides]
MLLESKKYLIKQAEQSTGRTPLHYAALFGETEMTELLLEADASPAYLPDNKGSFPIHLAASNGQPDNVLALLRKSGPYYGKLRDGKGRTFLHVAAEAERLGVVMLACQEQGKVASSVMNMQDDDGNTTLHLAALAGNIRMVRALVSIPEVKLNLPNKGGRMPRDLAFKEHSTGSCLYTWNSRYRIHLLLRDACDSIDWRPRIELSWTEFKSALDEMERSQNIVDQSQIIALGSVLITTVTFAAAFAVPGATEQMTIKRAAHRRLPGNTSSTRSSLPTHWHSSALHYPCSFSCMQGWVQT